MLFSSFILSFYITLLQFKKNHIISNYPYVPDVCTGAVPNASHTFQRHREKKPISKNSRSIDTGTDPFPEQRTTSGMTAPGTRHSALDTAPISTSNKVGGSLRRLPHQALSMPNTEYDDHPYEMPRVWILIIVSWGRGKLEAFRG